MRRRTGEDQDGCLESKRPPGPNPPAVANAGVRNWRQRYRPSPQPSWSSGHWVGRRPHSYGGWHLWKRIQLALTWCRRVLGRRSWPGWIRCCGRSDMVVLMSLQRIITGLPRWASSLGQNPSTLLQLVPSKQDLLLVKAGKGSVLRNGATPPALLEFNGCLSETPLLVGLPSCTLPASHGPVAKANAGAQRDEHKTTYRPGSAT